MQKKTLRDIDVAGKTVLVRVDFNVPIKNGVVGDTLRIEASFETIRFLMQQHCRIVLISHLGRPDGKADPKYSLEPVARKASELLGAPIAFAHECIGPQVQATIHDLPPGGIILLENLRYHAAEEANDTGFARSLAALAEVYVDDAFAAIHRAHASTVGITKFLPGVAGFLVEREVIYITQALAEPKRPLLAIVGGAKVSSKIDVLKNLMVRVDRMLIGGAMANTFFAAQDKPIGRSMYEPDHLATAREIMELAREYAVDFILPGDMVVTKDIESGLGKVVELEMIESDDIIVDLGPISADYAFRADHAPATVIWNGPIGITEVPAFAQGSQRLAEAIINSGARCIIGGGDTAAFVDAAGLHDKFGWVSTGGGASLELMAGKELPGVAALEDK